MKPDEASSFLSNRTSHNQGKSAVNKSCIQMLFKKTGQAVPVEGEFIAKLGWPNAHFLQKCYQSRDIAVVESYGPSPTSQNFSSLELSQNHLSHL